MEFYKDRRGMPISWVNPVRKDGALTPPSLPAPPSVGTGAGRQGGGTHAFYLYHSQNKC